MEEPKLIKGDKFWLDSWSELNTCRNSWFLIPHNTIVEYGYRLGLSNDFVDGLAIVVRTMDIVYRHWYEEEKKKKDNINKSTKGSPDAT